LCGVNVQSSFSGSGREVGIVVWIQSVLDIELSVLSEQILVFAQRRLLSKELMLGSP
jgi:hypothetical protein